MFQSTKCALVCGLLAVSLAAIQAEEVYPGEYAPVADPVLADPGLLDPVLADPGLLDPVLADPVLVDDSNSISGEEEGFGSLLFPNLDVDLNAGTSYISDSNTSQTPIATSASLFAFSYGANVASGSEAKKGAYYGIDYQGQAYLYEDAIADLGRDPFEHALRGFVGVNGGQTRIRFNTSYHRNNGNSIQFDQIQRETRRAASNDYNFDLTVVRDLSRGSLEAGTGYTLRDFDEGTGFNDGESSYGDLGWMTTPSFAPKSNMGVGARFGSDNYSGNASQSYITPSFRWRYRFSGKTSLYSTIGTEFRSVDGAGGKDSQNFVYNGGVDWTPSPKTSFLFGYYRRVQPSYVINGDDITNTGVNLTMNNKLPGRFRLSTRLGYENADYFADQVRTAADREDQFFRLGLDLNHPLVINRKLGGQWGIFYNFNENTSNQAAVEFEQNVTGVRVGLVY